MFSGFSDKTNIPFAPKAKKIIEKIDLDADVLGSIDFIDENGKTRWAYFNQIKKDNEKEKENAVTYTLAQLHLYKKDFNKVLELLRFVEYKELSRKLNSKVMLINTYVELKEIEPLYSLLDSFRTFLGRNTQINKEKQTSFLILIKFVRRYISIQSTEIQKFKELKLKIEESESFVNKSWLLEKINSSINN